jgi:hypothetical protein
VGGSLLASGTDHAPAHTYYGISPAWKLFEDPVPRLALLLPYHQALLVYRVPWDIHPYAQTALLLGLTRTPVIIATNIRIAIAQITIIIATG